MKHAATHQPRRLMPIAANGSSDGFRSTSAAGHPNRQPSATAAVIHTFGFADTIFRIVIGHNRHSMIGIKDQVGGRILRIAQAVMATGITTNDQAGKTSHGRMSQKSVGGYRTSPNWIEYGP